MARDMARTLSAKEIAMQHAVSPRTIRSMAANGELPCDKLRNQYRFDAEEVAQAIQFSRGCGGEGGRR